MESEHKINIAYFTAEYACYKTNGASKVCNSAKKGYIDSSKKTSFCDIDYFYVLKNQENFDTLPDQIIPLHVKSKEEIKKIIDTKILILDGFRFPDRLITRLRNEKFHKNIYIQHGRYTKIKRSWFSRHVIRKLYYYGLFAFRCFLISPLRTIKAIFQKRTIVDLGFLYSPMNYWLNYHKERNFEFNKSKIIADSDLSKFIVEEKLNSKAVIYLAQSIFEDGRCDKRPLVDFANLLEDFCDLNNLELHIRPHPRSNFNLLKEIFPKNKILKINSNKLINPLFVITHHSAMAIIFLQKSIPTFFFKVNQEEIPYGLMEYEQAFLLDEKMNINLKKINALKLRKALNFKYKNDIYLSIYEEFYK